MSYAVEESHPEDFNTAYLSLIMQDLKLGTYQHYKGKFYEVIGIGRHSETLEELVVYHALYDSKEFGKNAIWVRPKSIFLEDVTVNGKEVSRFKYVEYRVF